MFPAGERNIYHIIPHGAIGWDFKKAGSRTIIKLMSDKNQLREFALNYCQNNSFCHSILMVFDYHGKLDEVVPFEPVANAE